MLELADISYTDKHPANPAGYESGIVPASKRTISIQTQWMLLVRDERDQSAFASLFDHYAPRLKAFIINSGSSAAQAEDIVQDVMLTIWQKSTQFDPHRAQVSAWIYQIARNKQIDLFRKYSRPIPEELKEPEGVENDATQILELEQETEYLKQALLNLTPDQRKAIEKTYMGELTHQEVSQQTGLPLGNNKITYSARTGSFEIRITRIKIDAHCETSYSRCNVSGLRGWSSTKAICRCYHQPCFYVRGMSCIP
jgi:RNA polymerase sigma-70 factor (ECF subfamily)